LLSGVVTGKSIVPSHCCTHNGCHSAGYTTLRRTRVQAMANCSMTVNTEVAQKARKPERQVLPIQKQHQNIHRYEPSKRTRIPNKHAHSKTKFRLLHAVKKEQRISPTSVPCCSPFSSSPSPPANEFRSKQCARPLNNKTNGLVVTTPEHPSLVGVIMKSHNDPEFNSLLLHKRLH